MLWFIFLRKVTMKPHNPASNSEFNDLLAELRALRTQVEERSALRLGEFTQHFGEEGITPSACNMAHYLALRQFDLRRLQERLARSGLSSLGRIEANVLPNLDAIIGLLASALGEPDSALSPYADVGKRLLEKHTDEIFGPMDGEREVRIMVTMPTSAAEDYKLIKNLLRAGTNCIRINCAHDDATAWAAMIHNVRRASKETRRHCRVLMDLGGHKLRTGPLAEAPKILACKPKRDDFGQVVEPVEIMLYNAQAKKPPDLDKKTISVSGEVFKLFKAGDLLNFIDTRGKPRSLQLIRHPSRNVWLAHCEKLTYLGDAVMATLVRGEGEILGETTLSIFNESKVDIRVKVGEPLLLSFNDEPGQPALRNANGKLVMPARIGCGEEEVKHCLQLGDPVWFDDGKIGSVVEKIRKDGVLLRVTQAKNNGSRLVSDKGINFPKTKLQLPALSNKDLHDLDFVCQHADMVGFSFVESLEDLEYMLQQLDQRGGANLPVIAKIESDRSVRNLPDLILGGMGRHKLGVMIARGDLAVELGSVRLAEIQEEILWVCESAHVPVIWATQVLETMTKKGEPSRPEFTDAAMSVRAECVMLNKGNYIVRTVEVLADVLSRMQAHQRKKFSRLRALHW